MSITRPIPLVRIGTVYQQWHRAPLGSILSYGSTCTRGHDSDFKEFQRPMITVCAEGENNLKAMVAILPEVHLILEPPLDGAHRFFEHTMTFDYPAINVGDEYELVVADLSPAGLKRHFDVGDVVLAPDGSLLAFVGETSQEIFLVLQGESAWKLVGRPPGNIRIAGKLSVQAKIRDGRTEAMRQTQNNIRPQSSWLLDYAEPGI